MQHVSLHALRCKVLIGIKIFSMMRGPFHAIQGIRGKVFEVCQQIIARYFHLLIVLYQVT